MTEGIAAAERAGTSRELAWRLAPVGVALGSLALGVVALGHRSLTVDEAASAAAAQGSLGTVLSRIVHDDPGQAGGLLLLKLARTIGDSELALRLPSAIAVALAAGLLVVLGTMLLERVGGLVAGLAFAVNAGVIEASREARPYALGLLGVVLATLLFVFALERGGGWRWIPYAVIAAALPLTHPLAASVLAAHGAALIALRERPDLRRAGIALVAGDGGCRRAARVDGRRPLRRARRRRSARPRRPRPRARPRDRQEPRPGDRCGGGCSTRCSLFAVPGPWSLARRARGSADRGAARRPAARCARAAGVHRRARPLRAGTRTRRGGGGAASVAGAGPRLGGRRVVAGVIGCDDRRSAPRGARPGLAGARRGGEARAGRQRDGRRRAGRAPGRSSRTTRRTCRWSATSGDRAAGSPSSPTRRTVRSRQRARSSRTPRYALLRQFAYGDGLRLQHWVRP